MALRGCGEYQIFSSAGSNPLAMNGASMNYVMVAASFKQASGAAGTFEDDSWSNPVLNAPNSVTTVWQ